VQEVITVKLDKNELVESIRQYLNKSGYVADDSGFNFRVNSFGVVTGVDARVLNISDK
jgi:hypothetical protein